MGHARIRWILMHHVCRLCIPRFLFRSFTKKPGKSFSKEEGVNQAGWLETLSLICSAAVGLSVVAVGLCACWGPARSCRPPSHWQRPLPRSNSKAQNPLRPKFEIVLEFLPEMKGPQIKFSTVRGKWEVSHRIFTRIEVPCPFLGRPAGVAQGLIIVTSPPQLRKSGGSHEQLTFSGFVRPMSRIRDGPLLGLAALFLSWLIVRKGIAGVGGGGGGGGEEKGFLCGHRGDGGGRREERGGS